MTAKTQKYIPLAVATMKAKTIIKSLMPHTERIHIAGAIRRHMAQVDRIDILCTPRIVENKDLFGQKDKPARSPAFIAQCLKLGALVNGDIYAGRAFELELPGGLLLRIYTATPDNWGYMLIIRTGSTDYFKEVISRGLRKHGFRGIDGMLTKGSWAVPMPEEIDVFKIINMPWIDPRARKWDAWRRRD